MVGSKELCSAGTHENGREGLKSHDRHTTAVTSVSLFGLSRTRVCSFKLPLSMNVYVSYVHIYLMVSFNVDRPTGKLMRQHRG